MSTHAPEIKKQAIFNANIEKVWTAVATQEGINSWFMPNDFKQELDYTFTIQSPFGPQVCKVTELDPPNKLVFTWGEFGWQVSFELKEVEDKTEFTLVHSGWGPQDELVPGPANKTNLDIRNTMNGGWESIVNARLREVVEG
ncbi:SRPBCC domain-containing protein [Bacillus sp. BGMRC 2118]|nr:SRPBCC domain-containing protein [Bacillus sp. BGMRC 2118]